LTKHMISRWLKKGIFFNTFRTCKIMAKS